MWACPIGSADEAPCPTLNLQEAMRFKPVASTGVTRRSKQPLRLGGYDVPTGAILMVPFDAVHRCNFERPDDFWPVRACGAGVPARLLRLCTATRERKEARPLPALVLGCAPAGGSCWRAASQSCSIRAPALGLWFCALPVRRAPPRHRQRDSYGPAVSLSSPAQERWLDPMAAYLPEEGAPAHDGEPAPGSASPLAKPAPGASTPPATPALGPATPGASPAPVSASPPATPALGTTAAGLAPGAASPPTTLLLGPATPGAELAPAAAPSPATPALDAAASGLPGGPAPPAASPGGGAPKRFLAFSTGPRQVRPGGKRVCGCIPCWLHGGVPGGD